MKRVVILGGGFGGIAAAVRLRDLLAPEDEVVLIDKGTHFAMGFRKTSAIVGGAPVDEGVRPLAALGRLGVRVVHAPITVVDVAARSVVAGGETFDADAILVALGAETVPAAVPGLAEHGIDVYSREGVPRARAALDGLADGATLAIGIFGAPYKCPPAPFELALLLYERLLGRRIAIEVFSPLPVSLPVLGSAGCEVIESRLLGVMIGFRRGAKAASVAADRVVFEDGDTLPFDVLFAVPPHRVPTVVTDAGLAKPGGWIAVDPRTLATSFPGVWAVGDAVAIAMANGQPMPKAGGFAEGEGIIAAEHIAAFLAGTQSDARFEGEGSCYLEVGNGEAMLVRGRFLAEPAPEVELTIPSKESLAQKHAYEHSRLTAWFGDGD